MRKRPKPQRSPRRALRAVRRAGDRGPGLSLQKNERLASLQAVSEDRSGRPGGSARTRRGVDEIARPLADACIRRTPSTPHGRGGRARLKKMRGWNREHRSIDWSKVATRLDLAPPGAPTPRPGGPRRPVNASPCRRGAHRENRARVPEIRSGPTGFRHVRAPWKATTCAKRRSSAGR